MLVYWQAVLLTLLIVQVHCIWERHALSEPRMSLASATAGEIVLFGGGSFVTYQSAVDVYNLTLQGWETPTELSQSRGYLAAAGAGDLILFGGGNDGTGIYKDTVDIYDVSVGAWLAVDALSVGRTCLTATSLGELIFFAGGLETGVSQSKIVDIYNVTSRGWETATNLSEGRSYLVSAAAPEGEVVLFAGGYNTSGYSDVVDIFNMTSMTWETPTNLSVGRLKSAAASSGDLIFIAGGYDGTSVRNEIDIYNVTLSGWMPLDALSVARSSLVGASTSSFVAFAGGIEVATPFSVVDYYDLKTEQWRRMSLTQSRDKFTAVGTEFSGIQRAFFAGGGDSGRVDIFSLQGEPSKLYEPRYGLAAAKSSIGGNESEVVMFAGGINDADTETVDILNTSTLETTLDFLSTGRDFLAASAVEKLFCLLEVKMGP